MRSTALSAPPIWRNNTVLLVPHTAASERRIGCASEAGSREHYSERDTKPIMRPSPTTSPAGVSLLLALINVALVLLMFALPFLAYAVPGTLSALVLLLAPITCCLTLPLSGLIGIVLGVVALRRSEDESGPGLAWVIVGLVINGVLF